MSRRTLESHGAFFLPHITDDMSILDCGFGPGTITCDIAEQVPRGKVVGVDVDESQVRVARENTDKRGTRNVEFRHGSAYELPFQADSFGAVFTHALLEHLSEPARAVEEFRRVLRPGGILATCSPDWGGFLIVPQSHSLSVAIEAYKSLQVRNAEMSTLGGSSPPSLSRLDSRTSICEPGARCTSPSDSLESTLPLSFRTPGKLSTPRL